MKKFHVGQTVMRVEVSDYKHFGVKGQKYVLTYASKAMLNGYNVDTEEKLIGGDPSAFAFVVAETLTPDMFV